MTPTSNSLIGSLNLILVNKHLRKGSELVLKMSTQFLDVFYERRNNKKLTHIPMGILHLTHLIEEISGYCNILFHPKVLIGITMKLEVLISTPNHPLLTINKPKITAVIFRT